MAGGRATVVEFEFKKKYDLVMVLWEDCASASTWVTPRQAKGLGKVLPKCKTVGFMVQDGADQIILAGTAGFRAESEQLNSVSIIPRAQVRKAVYLGKF